MIRKIGLLLLIMIGMATVGIGQPMPGPIATVSPAELKVKTDVTVNQQDGKITLTGTATTIPNITVIANTSHLVLIPKLGGISRSFPANFTSPGQWSAQSTGAVPGGEYTAFVISTIRDTAMQPPADTLWSSEIQTVTVPGNGPNQVVPDSPYAKLVFETDRPKRMFSGAIFGSVQPVFDNTTHQPLAGQVIAGNRSEVPPTMVLLPVRGGQFYRIAGGVTSTDPPIIYTATSTPKPPSPLYHVYMYMYFSLYDNQTAYQNNQPRSSQLVATPVKSSY